MNSFLGFTAPFNVFQIGDSEHPTRLTYCTNINVITNSTSTSIQQTLTDYGDRQPNTKIYVYVNSQELETLFKSLLRNSTAFPMIASCPEEKLEVVRVSGN